MNELDIKTGQDLREYRLKYRIPQREICEMTDIPQWQLSAYESGETVVPDGQKQSIIHAVKDCAEGNYPYVPVKRIRRKTTRYSSTNLQANPEQMETLRKLILTCGKTFTDIAALCKVSTRFIEQITQKRRKSIALVDYRTIINAIKPAQTPQAQQQTPQAQHVPAKSEHIHYTSCPAEKARLLAAMLRELEITPARAAAHLGMPVEVMQAKLDGTMPIYQPEYSAALSFIKSGKAVETPPQRRQLTLF